MKYLLDLHAHFYSEFSAQHFWENALDNFRQIHSDLGAADLRYGIVVLDTARGGGAGVLLERLRIELGVAINSFDNFDCVSLGQDCLYVFRGSQLVSQEGIEVLSLFESYCAPGALLLSELVAALREQQAVVVLPWSFGKWWGKRGVILKSFLQGNGDLRGICIGDICQRPAIFGSLQSSINLGSGLTTLAGSDPLPLVGDEARVARLVTEVDLDVSEEAELVMTLKEALKSDLSLRTLGIRDSVLSLFGRFIYFKLHSLFQR